MSRKLIIGASVLALLAGQAQAATLQFQGLAAVDNGQGFVPAVNNMQLSPGDRVRAQKGCALIVYHEGAESKICNGGMAVVVADMYPAPVGSSFKDTPVMVAPVSQFDWLPGLLLFGAGLGVACGLGCNNSQNYMSPVIPVSP